MLPPHPRPTSEQVHRDRGSILVLTLVLTVILAVVVLAIARYVTTGLQASEVTTERTETNAAASAALTWVIEEFSAKRLQPAADCSAYDTVLAVPAGVAPTGTTTVTCSPLDEIGNHPAVELLATTTIGGVTRTIEVMLQVPLTDYNAQVRSWDAN